MTHPSTSGPADAPDDRRADPPLPAAAIQRERADGGPDGGPALSEAERETAATIRSISRLEESS